MQLSGTIKRVCDSCFGGDAVAMRLYAQEYLLHKNVPPLGRVFRDIIPGRNRHKWWKQALSALDAALKPGHAGQTNSMEKKEYRTIKALVFDYVRKVNGHGNYNDVTRLLSQHFPHSHWKKSHWAWYRYQITKGRFKDEFPAEVIANLKVGGQLPATAPSAPVVTPHQAAPERGRGPHARDPEVKRIGDHLLSQVRFIIALAAKEDVDLRFRLNRWVFSRLMHDEIRIKKPIKKILWNSGVRACQACGERFESIKGVEIHRKSATSNYSVENCELLCRECHEQLP